MMSTSILFFFVRKEAVMIRVPCISQTKLSVPTWKASGLFPGCVLHPPAYAKKTTKTHRKEVLST
ncbi:hypothetical protein DPMN_100015 [Dreissena polymorpha]|uniref:Uncharacterized protein n=1 Tax=Dreissena polymorpha TaxID=45954 RepID=A0A9D4LF55_DREPO|nr:hypothetical protein DPMN_100015 [Dreissena polymorpha]